MLQKIEIHYALPYFVEVDDTSINSADPNLNFICYHIFRNKKTTKENFIKFLKTLKEIKKANQNRQWMFEK